MFEHLPAGALSHDPNAYLAATSGGLGSCGVGAFMDDEINAMLGVDGVDEAVVYMLAVGAAAAVLAESQNVRAYPAPYGINAAHLLGYLSPITESELDEATLEQARRNPLRALDNIAAKPAEVQETLRQAPTIGASPSWLSIASSISAKRLPVSPRGRSRASTRRSRMLRGASLLSSRAASPSSGTGSQTSKLG